MKLKDYRTLTIDGSKANKVHLGYRDEKGWYKFLCGLNVNFLGWLTIGSCFRNHKQLFTRITCKTCKAKFDGTISKQNSKNARGQKTHPWNQTRYGNGSRGTGSVFESSI